jgi:hypothetical protein
MALKMWMRMSIARMGKCLTALLGMPLAPGILAHYEALDGVLNLVRVV